MNERRRVVVALCLAVVLALAWRADAQNAWQPNTAYAVGQTVTFNAALYRCRQAHTSLPGWEPPNTEALWTRL